VRLEDGERGHSARTIARRLSSVSGLFAYLLARGDTALKSNPVPRGLASRRPGRRRGPGGVPLLRTPRTLPQDAAPAVPRASLRDGRLLRCGCPRSAASPNRTEGVRPRTAVPPVLRGRGSGLYGRLLPPPPPVAPGTRSAREVQTASVGRPPRIRRLDDRSGNRLTPKKNPGPRKFPGPREVVVAALRDGGHLELNGWPRCRARSP
jgi:hypothetical protein